MHSRKLILCIHDLLLHLDQLRDALLVQVLQIGVLGVEIKVLPDLLRVFLGQAEINLYVSLTELFIKFFNLFILLILFMIQPCHLFLKLCSIRIYLFVIGSEYFFEVVNGGSYFKSRRNIITKTYYTIHHFLFATPCR